MKLLEDFSFLGDKQWPPGFRFHPTDEELVLYYLKRKICRRRLKLNVIGELDVYAYDPEELPGLSQLNTGDRQWFFFSPRDRKYPNGGRANRATKLGYWKATGKDRAITCNSRCVGNKKTLVFYKGRAPAGLRTDWVMHEYTLDEEELKRCPTDQDYYALYKLYKKSGPGPKNGEQYGAPFREEDWADDENAIAVADSEPVVPPMHVDSHAPFDSSGVNCHANSLLNDLKEFMNQVANDPSFEPVMAFNNVQIAGAGEETNTPWVQQSLFEANVEDRAIVIPQNQECNHEDASFNHTQSATSLLQETSEVTSAPNKSRQGFCESKEDILEDFLEIDDFIIPELTSQNIENPIEGLRLEDIDGLCELDVFQDANMFLQDLGNAEPLSNTHISNLENEIYSPFRSSCANNFECGPCGVVDHVSNFCFDGFQTEMGQPTSDMTLENGMGSQANYQPAPDHAVASQPCIQNESFITATQTQSNQGSIPPSSGVIYAGVNQSHSPKQNHSQNQNPSGRDNEDGDSWFSSTLWSFVESIPTTPASAAESTILVNKALERLSSFGRRRDNVKVSLANNKSAVALNPASTYWRSRTRFIRGLLLFSILGAFCAVLWMMTETFIRVLS